MFVEKKEQIPLLLKFPVKILRSQRENPVLILVKEVDEFLRHLDIQDSLILENLLEVPDLFLQGLTLAHLEGDPVQKIRHGVDGAVHHVKTQFCRLAMRGVDPVDGGFEFPGNSCYKF